MLKQQEKFDNLLNNIIVIINTIQKTAINGCDDYLNAYKSLEEIVKFCDKLYIFVDNVRQCNSLDKSPDLNNLQ